MTMKSVCDCFNFIDSMILGNMEKNAGVEHLKDIHDFMITIYNDKYIEDMVSILGVFSQINLIIERFHLDNESDIKKQNTTLRKRILALLQEINTMLEVDNDE